MPKLEPKFIQKELESQRVRPLYWIHGPERMKIRELVKRIEKTALGDAGKSEFNYEKLDGSDYTLDGVLDSFQSLSMLGGLKLIVVHHADELKNMDAFPAFLKNFGSTDPVNPSELSSVVVFLAKGFDSRRKWAKAFQDSGAVVLAEEVAEQDREPWIDYMAKRRGMVITGPEKALLRSLEPWSLEIIDQEISKMDLVKDDSALREEVILSGVDAHARDEFIDALFSKDHARALKWVKRFGEDMDMQLPILGLIAWNLRHLKVLLIEQETRSRSPEKRNPYLMKNLDRWKKAWTVRSLQRLEEQLFLMDFSLQHHSHPPIYIGKNYL